MFLFEFILQSTLRSTSGLPVILKVTWGSTGFSSRGQLFRDRCAGEGLIVTVLSDAVLCFAQEAKSPLSQPPVLWKLKGD